MAERTSGAATRLISFFLAFLIFGSAVGLAVYTIANLDKDTTAQDAATVLKAQQEKEAQNKAQAEAQAQAAEEAKKMDTPAASEPVAEAVPVPVTELQSIDEVVGTGAEVTSIDQPLTFNYHGWRASDGVVFDSSYRRGQPITYPLSSLIKGWQQGMIGMKEGGKRKLIIPSALGYGDRASGDKLPANTDLVFVIELVKVDATPAAQ